VHRRFSQGVNYRFGNNHKILIKTLFETSDIDKVDDIMARVVINLIYAVTHESLPVRSRRIRKILSKSGRCRDKPEMFDARQPTDEIFVKF
jgi:hypothetical protein